MTENRKNLATIALLTRLNERNYVTRNNRVTRFPLRNKHFNSGFCPFFIFFTITAKQTTTTTTTIYWYSHIDGVT